VLRILDSKAPATRALLTNAPTLADYVNQQSRDQFNELLQLLDAAGIGYTLNTALVRGLDYYNGIVFEWTTDKLGAQATVCAGGRYDNLSKQLGGSATPAVGFAMGVERVLLMLEETATLPAGLDRAADVYLALVGAGVQSQGLLLARELRRALPSLRVLTHCGGGKYNAQLKKAYASGARCAVILEGDCPQSSAKFRVLDSEGSMQELVLDALVPQLTRFFKLL
jgi:histidyl-tRNA synthetase